ncbi:hypothetical protein SLS54_007608 [Diplodia seriata]
MPQVLHHFADRWLSRFAKLSSSLVIFEFDKLSQAEAAIKAKSELECPGQLQCISVAEYAKLLNNVHPSLGVFNKYEAQVLVNAKSELECPGQLHCISVAEYAKLLNNVHPSLGVFNKYEAQVLVNVTQRAVVCLGLISSPVFVELSRSPNRMEACVDSP